jgi:murein L,D-transpeptidase YcbB/YkuD
MVRAGLSLGAALSVAIASAAAAQEAAVPSPPVPRAEAITVVDLVPPGDPAFASALDVALASVDETTAGAIAGFYAQRGFAPFWSEDGRTERLVALFEASAGHGLPPERYLGLVVETANAERAEREAALSRAYLRLARDLAGGLVTPATVDTDISVVPERPAEAVLMERLHALSLDDAVLGLAPAHPDYAALMAEKDRLEALALTGGWGATVPEGPTLREGDRALRVIALRERLARLGFPAATAEASAGATLAAAGDPALFDAALADAVQRFQRDHGLLDDGIAGARTLAAVNASVEDRIGQVLVNLERLRWLGDLGGRYVYVNIPDFSVRVMEGDEAVYETRAVVGQTATETPEFSETMTYLVVNPTWYIPDSIARRVYLPKLRTDPGVIERSEMRLFTTSGTEIDPRLVDFSQLEAGAFPFRVRQNPSSSNALGAVKFMFPNQHAIYLHDTPAKELFDRDARAFSNGCVRLERPFEFAAYLLDGQLDDAVGTFQSWVEAGSERYVTLETPIEVHITYRTAWSGPDGIEYRADVYGRDAALVAALAERGVTVPGPQG